ncbi:TetR family transcriptional regulator [Rhodococcus sp. NPDC057014]|uniref:TetR family transcriptional regulator n=1 Tax=Rhodococcus sp. NPDC057014 TaxID=3346000 RepID=UPI003642BC0C
MPRCNPLDGTALQIRNVAAQEFGRLGHSRTTIRGIAEGLQLTKGAVYCHYPSKISLARAVVEEGILQLVTLCTSPLQARSPALEALIDISFVVAVAGERNTLIQSAFRLSAEVGDCLSDIAPILTTLVTAIRDLVCRAISQADLRDDVDPDDVARLVVDLSYGVRHLTVGARRSPVRIARCWLLLLPGLVDEEHVKYFRQFVTLRAHTAETASAQSPGRRIERRSVSLTDLPIQRVDHNSGSAIMEVSPQQFPGSTTRADLLSLRPSLVPRKFESATPPADPRTP